MTARYNVVFVGKTGVGKSALINYLYGDKIRETGVGKPVTQRGFHHVDDEIDGLPVRFFDSWGLEVGREQEWLGLLNEELKKRDTRKPAEQWFHSVFYCIAGIGHRVEDSDIKIIKRFTEEKYKVAVILTKADLISEEDEEKLRDTVQNDLGQAVPVIPVCSEEKQLRGGRISEKFGKEKVELQAYNDFWDSIILRLPEHCVKVLEQRIDEWYEEQKKYIEKNTGCWNFQKIFQKIETEAKSFINNEFEEQNTVRQELQCTLELYGTFVQCLNYSPSETPISAIGMTGLLKTDKFWNELLFFLCMSMLDSPIIPFVAIIFRAGDNKKKLVEHIENFVSKIKQRLIEIESGIKEALLERLKEEKKVRYNAVFVGKTGVGKSALINYLYGDKIRETGVGKPVTPEGFHYVDDEINGLPVRFFDSWGLEVGKEQKWIGALNEELKKRGTGKPAEEWFHSVFYCIAGSGHRVENSDIQIIEQFIDEKYKVTVVLTKADLIWEDDVKEMRDTVQNALGQAIPVIPVCSEEKQLRGGIISEKFGKKDIELQAYNDFCDSIMLRLPEHCVKVLEQRIDGWHEKQKKYIEENTGRWNDEEIRHDIITESNSFVKKEFEERNTIKQELWHTLKLYGNFAQSLNYPPPETNFIMSLPTEQSDDDLEWYEWLLMPFAFIPLGAILGVRHLICGAEDNRKELLNDIEKFVSRIKQRLPEIELGIKEALEKLKEK